MTEGRLVGSYIVPVHPHTVLVPEQNEGWQRLRDALMMQHNASKMLMRTFGHLFHNMAEHHWPPNSG